MSSAPTQCARGDHVQFTRTGETFSATLAPDDVAFAVDLYPTPDGQASFGRISGTALLDDGQPVRGGLIAAVDASSGVVIGGLTNLSSGAYSILTPPGEYVVYLEPLNGPVRPEFLGLEDSAVSLLFQTTRFGGAEGGRTLAVSAGGAAVADITAQRGEPALDVDLLGLTVGTQILLGQGPRLLRSGRSSISLWGAGLQTVSEPGVELLGPHVQLVPGTVRFEPRLAMSSYTGALRFDVEVHPPTLPSQTLEGGTLSTIVVRSEGRIAAYTGSLVVEPDESRPPTFTAGGVTNAASFVAGPVAPGGLTSIFGLNLGPETPLAVGGFDPATGMLRTELGGVRVTFDGIAAPLVFVSRQQINLQVPYEIGGRTTAGVVVRSGELVSARVTVPVAAAAPGLFVIQGGAGAILNQDGSLNTPAAPESRGRAVVVYGTGQGLVEPLIPTGGPASGASLSVRGGVTATVGGQPAQVLFAGLAPGFVGLFQVNVLLPAGAPAGAAVPVEVRVDGVATQPGVTLSIAP